MRYGCYWGRLAILPQITNSELRVDPGHFFRCHTVVEKSSYRGDSGGAGSYYCPPKSSHFLPFRFECGLSDTVVAGRTGCQRQWSGCARPGYCALRVAYVLGSSRLSVREFHR